MDTEEKKNSQPKTFTKTLMLVNRTLIKHIHEHKNCIEK